MRRVPALAVALALLPAAAPAGGTELWRSGEHVLDFSGSLREVAFFTRGTDAGRFAEDASSGPAALLCARADTFADCPAFEAVGDKEVFESLTRLRLGFDLHWSDALTARLAYDHEWRIGFLDRLLGDLGGGEERDTFLGLEDRIGAFGLSDDADHRRWSHRVYRGWVRWSGSRAELTVGRQRLAWGVGRLWNPLDRFNFVPPLAIEADETPGIDAVDARWRFSGLDSIQLVYAPATRSADARAALRYHGVVRDVDVSLVAGSFEEARVLGFDLAANAGDAAVRLEAAWTDPERDVWRVGDPAPRERDPFWQVVVSADINFDVGRGLYVLVEHLYNGNALGFGEGRAGALLPFFEATADVPPALPGAGPGVRTASAAIFAGSQVVTGSRQTTGLQLSTDLTLALRGELLALYDWEGSSVAFFPSLAYTGWNAVELTAGVQLFAGPRRSDYGDREPLLFVLAEVFF